MALFLNCHRIQMGNDINLKIRLAAHLDENLFGITWYKKLFMCILITTKTSFVYLYIAIISAIV